MKQMESEWTRHMKLYKFRSLADEPSFCRTKDILQTGEFWCSRFWELNDPMEGIFLVSNSSNVDFTEVFSDKAKYAICSFSGRQALLRPTMWGYYASGFKGVAIEINVIADDVQHVEQVEYTCDLPCANQLPSNINARVRRILTTKANGWKHEHEFRYLVESDVSKKCRIGHITGVYFGDPYGNTANQASVRESSPALQEFLARRDALEAMAREKGFDRYRVHVSGNRVKPQKMASK